ncbi:MAG: 3'-5' exonuclease [Patescibacteria group bacterium]|jgi:hypothetical protein
MKDIMLDLETMSTGSYAAIISIGAVYFDGDKLGQRFYETVSLESVMAAKFSIDASTILWWMRQSDEARKEFGKSNKSIMIVLDEFSSFCKKRDNVRIWGNGSDFDNVILGNAYRVFKMDIPWKYTNNRCFRTVKNIHPLKIYPDTHNAHNALSDAVWQAECLIEIVKTYKFDLN